MTRRFVRHGTDDADDTQNPHNRSATGDLRREHRVILDVVGALDRMTRDALHGDLPLDDIDDCVTFFRLHTDRCHHGKEEDLLFTELQDHGLEGSAGPIAALRDEHRHGRVLVRTIADAAGRLRQGDRNARTSLIGAVEEYCDFIRSHIAREDDGIFELADDLLRGDACARLCDAYDASCHVRYDGRTRADLEDLAARLAHRYPPR